MYLQLNTSLMKTSIHLLVTILVVSGMFITSCKSPAEKEVTSESEMVEAQEALEQERKALQQEVDAYRESLNERIAANEQNIREYQSKIASQKSDTRLAYEKKIAELNTRNENLRLKMSDFQSESKQDWEAFKNELDRDMEELGNAFKDFTIKN
jgi:outer membrane murein-binding lipoprotein Lpp